MTSLQTFASFSLGKVSTDAVRAPAILKNTKNEAKINILEANFNAYLFFLFFIFLFIFCVLGHRMSKWLFKASLA